MTLWTLDPIEGHDISVTLCEPHALSETNLVMAMTGVSDSFGSMQEAYTILTALTAAVGFDLGMHPTDSGTCDECTATSKEIA